MQRAQVRHNSLMSTWDALARPLRNLRLSVTDRCNLRCEYCMPEEHYTWLPREDVLDFEEIARLVDIFVSVGVDRLRVTGGEPLLRRGLPSLMRMVASRPGLLDVAMTTNGILLADHIDALKAAGLHRVTVSLDTLRPDRFLSLTRSSELSRVLDGITAAHRAYGTLKLDSVVMRGVNDDELIDLIEYARTVNAELRFIEYMDVGGATRWSADRVVSRREILERVAQVYGAPEPLDHAGSAPADRYRLGDGTTFGVISSTTEPFCRSCDRSRLTADGRWYLCLYGSHGADLRAALRSGASDADLRTLVTGRWETRDDRGAEVRLAVGDRRAFVPVGALKRDPHLEMHTRGG